MSFDHTVLRAMLRLARRRQEASDGAVAIRAGGDERAVRASMRRLEASGLLERRWGHGPRLTMAGLAAAVAMLPARSPASPKRARPPRAA